jgi:hypothetical protein
MLTQVPPLEVLPWYALVDLWGCFTRVSRQPFLCVFHFPLNKLRRLFIHSSCLRRKQSQGGSEFITLRSENHTNFSSDAQEKAVARGGQRGAPAVLSEFSLIPTNPTHQSVSDKQEGTKLTPHTAAPGRGGERARAREARPVRDGRRVTEPDGRQVSALREGWAGLGWKGWAASSPRRRCHRRKI